MKCLLFLVLSMFMLVGQSTKEVGKTDYSLLNGVWEGDCSMMVTGDLKGEIECPIMEATSITTISLNEKHEGIWVSQRDDNPPDTTKTKLIIRNKQAILQMEQKGKQWERHLLSVTKDSLKVYTSSKEYVSLFRRKKSS